MASDSLAFIYLILHNKSKYPGKNTEATETFSSFFCFFLLPLKHLEIILI